MFRVSKCQVLKNLLSGVQPMCLGGLLYSSVIRSSFLAPTDSHISQLSPF